MPNDLSGDSASEVRRNLALLAVVEAMEEGREPDHSELFAAHPDLRGDLEAFLTGHDEMLRLTAPVRAARRRDCHRVVETRGDDHDDRPAALGELGEFRLLREVGRGGMGVVYEADQKSLRRRVALKVLPFAAAIDARRLQRFKTEALAAAHLQHAHIVPVHAVGCERGVHYYAMQFIEGQSLAALVEGMRAVAPEQPEGAIGLGYQHLAAPNQRRIKAQHTLRRQSRVSARPTAAATSSEWRGWAAMRRWHLSTLTKPGSCIATSSRATCCSTCAGSSGSPTSAWPRSTAIPGSP